MAVESGFFEAEWDPELYNEETHELGDWDRKYLAEQFARYFSKFISTGVLNDVEDQLKVTNDVQMTLEVAPGFAFINGYWCYNPEPLALYVPLNQSPSTRYDSVRVRWNAITRKIEIVYIADDIVNVRNDLYYDLQIAQVKVEPGTTSIAAADITDTRSDETLCGLINIVKPEDIGDISSLETPVKTNIVAAINSFAWITLKNKPFASVDLNTFEIDQDGVLIVSSAKNDFILINKQALTFTNNVCEISDARITADSLADVYFTQASMQSAMRANVTVETTTGKVTLTAERTPESTLTATIKIRVV